MARLIKLLDNRQLFFIALIWLIIWIAAQMWPATWWMRVDYVLVEGGEPYEPLIMDVSREIRRPFVGHYHVLVRERMRDMDGTDHWVVVCSGHGGGNYIPSSPLSDPVTLEWWSGGHCDILHPGVYRIDTTWRWTPRPWPAQQKQVKSNVFTVGEPGKGSR